MAGSHHLIDEHLAALARRLPADVVDELADGLAETWTAHRATGLPPADAARATIADFGAPEEIVRAYITHSPGRRLAVTLLRTGPLVGLCWGTSLIAARFWTWPAPTAALAGFWLTLLAVVAMLVAAATGDTYRRTRLGTVGGLALVVLDTTMLTAVVTLAPTLVWPMAVAIPVSLARIGLTLRALPALRPA